MSALGRRVGQFRDALTSFALTIKTSVNHLEPGFVVTQKMLDDVYKRMLARNVDVPEEVYENARPLVSRLPMLSSTERLQMTG